MKKILYNRARCRGCGAVIESKHRHDFVTCACGAISIDGGTDYLKRVGDPKDFLDLSVCIDVPDKDS